MIWSVGGRCEGKVKGSDGARIGEVRRGEGGKEETGRLGRVRRD